MIQQMVFLLFQNNRLANPLTVLIVLHVLIVLLVLHVLPGRYGRGTEGIATKS